MAVSIVVPPDEVRSNQYFSEVTDLNRLQRKTFFCVRAPLTALFPDMLSQADLEAGRRSHADELGIGSSGWFLAVRRKSVGCKELIGLIKVIHIDSNGHQIPLEFVRLNHINMVTVFVLHPDADDALTVRNIIVPVAALKANRLKKSNC